MTEPPTFTEREPYEAGFAEIFSRDIAPKLEEAEESRLGYIEERRRRLKITVIATAVTAALLIALYFTLGLDLRLLVLSALVALIGYMWSSSTSVEYGDDLKDVIIGPACQFFDDLEYRREPDDRFDHKRFQKLGLVNSGNVSLEDLFTGSHRGTKFNMVEADITSRSHNTTTTEFKGLLFEIAAPIEFTCRVIIGRDSGNIGNALTGFFKSSFGKQERVTFDDAAFEKRYAVYTDNPDEAYRLVTPGLCKTMVDLADAYDEKSLSAAFVDNVFLLAMPVEDDLFELGSISQSALDCEDDIHKLLKSIIIAHRVIDYLHGDKPA